MTMFSPDGVLFRWMNRFSNLVFLNVLWLLCCIPVVTAGAATTAMYSVLLKMVKDEESYVVKSFFCAFAQNFKQSVGIWMMVILYVASLLLELVFCIHVPDAKWLFIPILWFAVIGMAVLTYVFPVLAFFEDSTKCVVKNAFLMAIAHIPQTVLMILVNGIPFFVLWFFSSFLSIATFFDLVVGFALSAWINARHLRNIFEKYLPAETGEDSNKQYVM